MKKLVFLFAAVLLTAISANTFAQSTGTTPAPGATHEYTITPGNSGNEILWTVTKGDLTTDAGTDAVISADDAATTNIKWDIDNTEIGTWYYVHVLETEGSGATACSNEKVLPVQITASPFTLDILAANGTQCYNDAVEVNLNTTTHTVTYDHGTATLEFTVTPTGLNSNYSGYTFNVAIGYNGYTYNANLDDSNVAVSSVTDLSASISGGLVTVNDNEAVKITYVIDNQNVFDNSSDANAQDYTATVTISNGVSDNGVSDNASGDHTEDTTDARPNTSGIGYN
jgi:hypothetical protein